MHYLSGLIGICNRQWFTCSISVLYHIGDEFCPADKYKENCREIKRVGIYDLFRQVIQLLQLRQV